MEVVAAVLACAGGVRAWEGGDEEPAEEDGDHLGDDDELDRECVVVGAGCFCVVGEEQERVEGGGGDDRDEEPKRSAPPASGEDAREHCIEREEDHGGSGRDMLRGGAGAGRGLRLAARLEECAQGIENVVTVVDLARDDFRLRVVFGVTEGFPEDIDEGAGAVGAGDLAIPEHIADREEVLFEYFCAESVV